MTIRRPIRLEVGSAHRCDLDETTNVRHKLIHPAAAPQKTDIGLALDFSFTLAAGRFPLNSRASKPPSLMMLFIYLNAVAA
jgi:hypothetical protein